MTLCVVSLVTLIFWELYQLKINKRPILNLTLFKRRTFAIPFVLMFVLGFTLYGTTVLIPQMVQTLLGYTAELAGLVISPGGVCIMCMMPVVGFLVGRVDPRYLICYGFAMLSMSMTDDAHVLAGVELQVHHVGARLPGVGAGVPVYPDQYDLLCGRAARAE